MASARWRGLRGTLSDNHQKQRDAYTRQGVEISEKKSQVREPVVVRMGALVDGLAGTVGAPLEKKFEVIGFTIWALSHKWPRNKAILMILGRLVRCFEFRRPLMSLLRDCWPKTPVQMRRPMTAHTYAVLIRSCIMLPLASASLRCPVDSLVTASDASEKGGGLCAAEQLSQEGLARLNALQSISYREHRLQPFQAAGAMPTSTLTGPRIFVLSLFDGVAAVMCALSRLPCQVVGFAASEIDPACKRLVRKRWPGVLELGQVEKIDEKVIQALVSSLGYEIDCLLIPAGSPCQDLTVLLAGRKGLEGSRSRLFFEIPRIIGICQRFFPNKVAFMVENVFSMTAQARDEFSRVLGVEPVLIEAGDLAWVRRPRLYWFSWPVKVQQGEKLESLGSYKHWQFPDVKPNKEHWVEDSWCYHGEGCLPTFTRSLPRSKPAAQPAGIAVASQTAIARWQNDRYRFQVYNYEDKNLLWRSNEWRLPSVLEREILMGFDKGYISNCLPPKMSASEKLDLGCCMIGNTFHVHAVTMIFHSLLQSLDPRVGPRDVKAIVHHTGEAPAGWTSFPSFAAKEPPDPRAGELVHEILRQGDRAGTDIRLDVGIPFRFKAFPRAGLRTNYFKWRIIHGYRWRYPSHINALELQAVVNGVSWRLRKLSNHRKRVLHLVDSQVVASIISKGRTSSFRLKKGIQRLNTLLLCSGVKLAVGYIHTTDNPADLPSRWADKPSEKLKGKSSEAGSSCAKALYHHSSKKGTKLHWSKWLAFSLSVTSWFPTLRSLMRQCALGLNISSMRVKQKGWLVTAWLAYNITFPVLRAI